MFKDVLYESKSPVAIIEAELDKSAVIKSFTRNPREEASGLYFSMMEIKEGYNS